MGKLQDPQVEGDRVLHRTSAAEASCGQIPDLLEDAVDNGDDLHELSIPNDHLSPEKAEAEDYQAYLGEADDKYAQGGRDKACYS